MSWWDDDPDLLGKKQEWDRVVDCFAGQRGKGWLRVNCPQCLELTGKEDKKFSLGYNTRTGGYNCFKCGMHGSLPRSYRDRVSDQDPDFLPAAPSPEAPKEPVEPAWGFMPLYEPPGIACSDLDFARMYLTMPRGERICAGAKCRGLLEENLWQIRPGAAVVGKLAGRVIIPIPDYHDPNGPWRGWVARDATGAAERPYLYPKHMDRIGLIYNEPALWVETDRPVYVVEGTLDAAALWPDAVAVLGKVLDSQVDALVKARRPVVACLDGDAWVEGQALAWTLQHLGQRAGNVVLPPKTDPDEVDRGWLDAAAEVALGRR